MTSGKKYFIKMFFGRKKIEMVNFAVLFGFHKQPGLPGATARAASEN